jgi:Protein of unknown function (DUF551)
MSEENLGISVEWMPIDTAPKDGSRFCGFNGKLCFLTYIGKYYIKWPHEQGGPTFREEWNAEDDSAIFSWKPTHWMPLPAPPVINAIETKQEILA